MKTSGSKHDIWSKHRGGSNLSSLWRKVSGMMMSGLVLLAASFVAQTAQAQQVTIVGQPVRVTVPVNYSGATNIACTVTITTNGLSSDDGNGNWVCGAITLSATGIPSTPDGLSFTFIDTNNLTMTAITPVIPMTDASITTNIWLWVNTTNVAEGIYPFSLDTGGAATDTLLLTLQVAHMWTGAANTAFANSGNWNGGNAPNSPTNDVVLTDVGAVGSGVVTTNILISSDTEIGSLRQAITSGSTRRHNIQINDGMTLKITGANGLSGGLRDRSDTSQAWELAFTGTNGTLVVSNTAANVDLFGMYNQVGSFFLNQLGTFVANVNQIHVSDYRDYPNYDNMRINGYSSSALPRQMAPGVNYFARTNVITCSFAGDTNNWQDPAIRDYSIVIGRNLSGGTTTRKNTYLGISNYFSINSICVAGFGVAMDQSSGDLQFNPALFANHPIAIFRGTNGTDRVAMFAICDGATPGSSGSSTKALVDLSGGTVDALVDQLYLSRDRTNASGGFSAAALTMGNGTFDVNDAILGYQGNGNNLNAAPTEDYCQGTLTIASNGIFRANDAIDLGYTTGDGVTDPAAATGFGQINVNNGGIVEANLIRVGGVTKISVNNTITINNGNVIVSNTIAGSDKYLTSLAINNGGTLTLFINGTNTTPYVYTTNLTTSGAASITIGGMVNMTLPQQVPLVRYAAGTPTLTLNLPPGYSGAIINNGPGSTIDAYITAGAPKSIVWRGFVNSDWNTTTTNWLDLNTGMPTNFVNLDDVSFDDAAGTPTTVNLAMANLIPASITMSNSTLSYTFSGPGTTVGTATLTKNGTNSLSIGSSTTLSVQLNAGSLTGGGTINSAVIASNATMNFSGTISAGVTCAGTAVNSGTINGTVTLQSGGVFTNLNTINGPFTLNSGSFMNNAATITGVGPTATVAANAYLLNSGTIDDTGIAAGGTVNVSGTLLDTGAGSFTLFRLNIQSGALFIPGGNGIGTTTINSDGIGTVPGRMSLSQGSVTLIKVNPTGTPVYTKLAAGCQDYGGSSSTRNQNGCTLLISNVTATAFSAGQVLNIFDNSFGGDAPLSTGTSTNTYPVIVPASPGPGLAWDLSQLWPNGYIGVINQPIVTLTNSFAVSPGKVVATLSWPAAQYGWVLQQQITPVNVGLTTNWTRLNNSLTNTTLNVTNTVGPSTNVFFRLVYP